MTIMLPVTRLSRARQRFRVHLPRPRDQVRGAWVRPHDLQLKPQPQPGALEARVCGVLDLGFEVRVELSCESEPSFWVRLARSAASELQVHQGKPVFVGCSKAGARVGEQPVVIAG
jgi:sulfate transport system ATP-binding protein